MTIKEYTREDFDVVIGMEFHVQVKSQTKLFSRASLSFGDEPNTHVSEVDAGMPGSLPTVNKFCVECGIKTALALNMKVSQVCSFDRKHYSYPDLPLGYQITQYYTPLGQDGFLVIGGNKVRLERLSLEADAGKNIHAGDHTYVDLNRCCSPLMEIVSAPDLRSEKEAAELFRKIRSIVRYIGTSDGDMEKGQLRADVNVSINFKGSKEYGTRVEIKNLNSMNFTQMAVAYEIDRHIACINAGKTLIMETRTFDHHTKQTMSMRVKESEMDYRFLPEPDLPMVSIPEELIKTFSKELPELPQVKTKRWMDKYALTLSEAEILADDAYIANFFDQAAGYLLEHGIEEKFVKQVASWMLGDLFALLNKSGQDLSQTKVSALSFGQLIEAIAKSTISGKQAKDVLLQMFETGKYAYDIIKEQGISQITDKAELLLLARKVINENSKQVEQIRAGKTNLFGFLVGQAMKLSDGKANPELLNDALKQALDA